MHEDWNYAKQESLKYAVFLDDQMHPYEARGNHSAHLFPEYGVPLLVYSYVLIRGPHGLIIDTLHHWASQDIRRITFSTVFSTMNHTIETSWGNFLPSCTEPNCRMIEEFKRIWMDAVMA
jgi:hypothetical protein